MLLRLLLLLPDHLHRGPPSCIITIIYIIRSTFSHDQSRYLGLLAALLLINGGEIVLIIVHFLMD